MRALFLVVLFATALLATIAAATATDATDANFNEVIKSAEIVLMEFYAPWCGHCKKLAPEWDAAAETLKKDGVNAVLAKMDATVETESPEKFEIKGYPTIKVFRDGEVAGDYDGKRDAAGIVQWVKANSGPAITTVETSEQLEAVQKDNAVVFVWFGPSEGAAFDAFEKVAKAQRAQFRFVTAPATAAHAAGQVVVFKHFDDKEETFTGDATSAKDLTTFVAESGMRLFQEMGPDNYKSYIDRGLPIGWLFMKPNEEGSDAASAIFETIAKEHKGKISLVWIDAVKYGGMAQRMGLSGTVFPSIVIDKDNKHFAFDESSAITEEAVRKHFDDFASGALKQTIRSQATPTENPTKGLWTVVGNTFDDLIKNNKEDDMLIKFYAPWCGHCKTLAPIYDELAEKVADVSNLKIMKFDAANNDFDTDFHQIAGYPTLLFVKKGEAPIPYEGARTLDGLLEFVKTHSSADFDGKQKGAASDKNEEL